MTDVLVPAPQPPRVWRTVGSGLLMAVSIQLAGTVPLLTLMRLNARHSPETPWAAMAIVCWLIVLCVWLSGRGWPKGSSVFRRQHMRLWRPAPGAWDGESRTSILGLIGLLVTFGVMYSVIGSLRAPVDVSVYPTTAIRFSLLLMGPLVARVVEEAAFRGYMQSHLERIGPTFAIMVTSLAFTLAHITHGLAYLVTVAPGFFLASVVYGYLAQKSGTIVPGMILHFLGDLAFSYFALLGGDGSLLFAR